jgi:hypothetical protein
MQLLRGGHEDVALSRRELDIIGCWIDLLVPFCGDYREAHAWSRADLALYDRGEDQRRRMLRIEEAGIRQLIAEKNGCPDKGAEEPGTVKMAEK